MDNFDKPDPDYSLEDKICPECERELSREQRCCYCEERLSIEAHKEYMRQIRDWHNDMGV